MTSIIVDTRKKFGSAGEAFLYHEGVITGCSVANRYKLMGLKTLDDGLKHLLSRKMFWGRWIGNIKSLLII